MPAIGNNPRTRHMFLLFGVVIVFYILINSRHLLACYLTSSPAPVVRGARERIKSTTSFTQDEVRPTADEGRFNEVQNRRRSLLREKCKRHNLGTISDEFDATRLHRQVKLLYSDNHKFILCEIPKCASPSMKKVLVAAEKLVDTSNLAKVESGFAVQLTNANLNLKKLRNSKEISEKLKTYKRLIIVRDPLYRLLSAYRSKLEREYPWNREYKNISRMIHTIISGDSRRDISATFGEFLRYAAMDKRRDRHWSLYQDLCLPCTIRYDYILHVETINDDMAAFMKLVNMENITFPANYASSRQTDQEKVNGYLASVSTKTIEDIYKRYRLDFELFGFSKPSIL